MDELSKRSRELLRAFAVEAKPTPARATSVWVNVARGVEVGHASGSGTPSTMGSPLGVLVATGIAAVVGWGAVQNVGNSPRSIRPAIEEVERARPHLVEKDLAADMRCEPPWVDDAPSDVEASRAKQGSVVRADAEVPPKPVVGTAGGTSPARSQPRTRPPVLDEDDAAASNRLAAEIASLAQLRLALRAGRFASALESVERHRNEFPDGALVEEAHVLHFDALCGSGNTEAAAHTGRLFLARWPHSNSSARIERGCPDPQPAPTTKED